MKHIKIALMVAIIAIGQTFIGGNAFARNHLPRLHQAAEDGDIAEITIMLTTMLTTRPRKGVLGLINKKDYYGKTPLHYAVRRFHTDAAIVLIQYGADINATDSDGESPLSRVISRFPADDAITFLKGISSDINTIKNNAGATPLHLAAVLGKTKTVYALVLEGADINAQLNDGDMPLHLAVKARQGDTAFALIVAGADINAQGENGWTPLHAIAYLGNSNKWLVFAKDFIEEGADVSIQNDLGETPLHIAIAEHGEDSRMVRLLRANESTWQMIKRWLFGD